MKKAVEIQNLKFAYHENLVFNDFNLDIKESSFVTITGANESGKSTLVKILSGLVSFEGKIKINNLDFNSKNLKEIRKNTAFVFETPINFFKAETLYENMVFHLKNLKLTDYEMNERITKIKEVLKLDQILYCPFNYLSGSEQQLASLACTLITYPKILILDNATSMLDEFQKDRVFKYLKKINRDEKVTIINFTNDVEETIYGTTVILLSDGNILMNKPTKKALLEEKVFKQCHLELPFMASLSLKLKYYGLIDDLILDMNKMVNKIWK